jgi:hypothetical protein
MAFGCASLLECSKNTFILFYACQQSQFRLEFAYFDTHSSNPDKVFKKLTLRVPIFFQRFDMFGNGSEYIFEIIYLICPDFELFYLAGLLIYIILTDKILSRESILSFLVVSYLQFLICTILTFNAKRFIALCTHSMSRVFHA